MKNHPYFDGIDWDMVIRGVSDPPFEPAELESNEKLDYDNFKNDFIGLNDELDAITVEQLRGELTNFHVIR